MQQRHTVGRAIPGRWRPRRARFRFARRANRSKTPNEEQEQSSAAVANGLVPRSIHLTPGGPLLLADYHQVLLALARRLVVETGAGQAQQLALPVDAQLRLARLHQGPLQI